MAEAYEKVLEAGWVAEGGQELSNCPHGCWKSDFTCPTDYPFDAVEVGLTEAGYLAHRNEIDASVLSTLACVCGQPLEYVGRRAPGSYRAFGVCGSCGHWLEF